MGDNDRMLRLAYVANPTSILVHRWVNFFARRGHDVTLLDGFGFPPVSGIDPRVRLVRYDARGRLRMPLAPTLHARATLRRLLAELAPDVVHAHFVKRYGWQVGIAGRHPYVISTWGSDVLLPPESIQGHLWNRWTLWRADVVTAVSDYMRNAAIRAGARPERVVQIQFGVDSRHFTPGQADASMLRGLDVDGGPFIFSPRAVKPIYNHETIARAFARLDGDVRLVMTARNADREYLDRLEALWDELGIRERVKLVDDIPDDGMLALHRAAAAVVSAPVSDSFPITLLEAMACGTPIVAGDLPPVRAVLHEIVPDALVPTRDEAAMAAALGQALALGSDERAHLGTRLRRAAVESADYESNMLRMEQVYRDLAERRRS